MRIETRIMQLAFNLSVTHLFSCDDQVFQVVPFDLIPSSLVGNVSSSEFATPAIKSGEYYTPHIYPFADPRTNNTKLLILGIGEPFTPKSAGQ
jgi:hypothetical protein